MFCKNNIYKGLSLYDVYARIWQRGKKMIIHSQILRDVVILELEKYKKLLIELGREGYEKVDELIQMLEEEEEGNGEDNRDGTENP